MCEILRHDANKWTAVLHLAGFGHRAQCDLRRGGRRQRYPDDQERRLGVAMGHAQLEVRARPIWSRATMKKTVWRCWLMMCCWGKEHVPNEKIDVGSEPSWISVDDGAHDQTLWRAG